MRLPYPCLVPTVMQGGACASPSRQVFGAGAGRGAALLHHRGRGRGVHARPAPLLPRHCHRWVLPCGGLWWLPSGWVARRLLQQGVVTLDEPTPATSSPPVGAWGRGRAKWFLAGGTSASLLQQRHLVADDVLQCLQQWQQWAGKRRRRRRRRRWNTRTRSLEAQPSTASQSIPPAAAGTMKKEER